MVQRTSAGGISQQGRSATGVRVMNLKEDDVVSAIALVVDDVEPGNGSVDGPPDAPSTETQDALLSTDEAGTPELDGSESTEDE
jgi:DNA gyrase subunit A